MPSLRQPVGPLPASIYWRRRVVVLAAVAAVVALIAWLMTDQGGGGDGGSQSKAAQAVPSQSQTPAQAITPGASPSGPAARPGGGGSGGGPVAGGGGTEVNLSGGGTGGANPAPGGGTGGSGGGAGGTGGGAAGGSGGAPAFNTAEVMALPVCASSQVALELAGTQNSFQPKDKPRLALTVKNSSGANCRVDLGRIASAITVSASNGDRVWSSGDCPSEKGSIWVQLAASGSQTETFTWDRSRSKPQCATADQTPPPNGTYVVLAELTGLSGDKVSARASIRLDN
ncbi:hypothetical protein GCM10018790_25540 [Kitasatospora xanthocidica]|uniref:hypothetical protein n=1 Tax=Kitasatospora xanthocidica TaxID=83382 RepID=UPI001673CC65|nr:hypothetical protein [Kitasatospora xanthocidica]GHF46888.1 hypothetical protein GCM10018790_25540 [Kitasatospora xanthocidica]